MQSDRSLLRSDEPPPTSTDADAEALFGTPPLPGPGTVKERLPVPICLPQATRGYDSPFVRGWHPQLVTSGIEQEDWLRFLDSLNIAMTASPPLRVVDFAGQVIGFIPYHWAMIAGTVIQTVAQTAMHVIQKTLTDRLLKRVNDTYFGPRGLKVRLMKTAAMRQFVGKDAKGEKPNKALAIAKSLGHGVESVAYRLPIPFLGRIVGVLNKSSHIDPNSTMSVTERRMADLNGYIYPVSFNVPPPKTPEALMDKASELCIKLRIWQGKRADNKAMRNRRLLAIAEGRAQPQYYNNPGYIDRKTRRKEYKAARRARRGKSSGVLTGRVAKADRLEHNATGELVWVVILNADQDEEIEGRELADNLQEEHIDDDDWTEQVEHENEQDEEEAIVAAQHKINTDLIQQVK